MSQLYFKIKGLTKKKSRRWPKHTQPSVVTSNIIAWCAVAATVVYSTGAMTHKAEIDGMTIKGTKVLVIEDVSGSMNSGRRNKLEKHRTNLKKSGMVLNKENNYGAHGLGVSNKYNNNLLKNIENGLGKDSEVDTIYAFSDFQASGDSWKSDETGYQRLEELLSEKGVRLYLGTVEHDPPEKLTEIAKKSGGGLITSK